MNVSVFLSVSYDLTPVLPTAKKKKCCDNQVKNVY